MVGLRMLFTPPVFADDDGKTRLAANFFVVAKVSWLAVLVSLPFLLPLMKLSIAIFYASFNLFFPTLMTVARRGYPKNAAIAYGLLTAALVTYSGYINGGNTASSFVGGTLVTVVVMSLLLGWRGGIGFAILAMLSGLLLAILKINGALPAWSSSAPLGSAIAQSVMLLTTVAATYAATQSLASALRRAETEIVQRRKAEAALQLSEQRYRLLAENIPNSAVLLFDHDLRFVLVDGPELAVTGHSKSGMEGKTLGEAFPPEFVAMAEPNMRRTLRGEQFTDELPFNDLFHLYHYVPLRDADHKIGLGLILIQNITDRKRIERVLYHYTQELEQMVEERTVELRTAKEQIEVIVEHTRDGIALIHTNGDIQLANPAFHAMFTENATKAIESILNCVPEVIGVQTLADGLISALLEQEQKAVETRIIAPNGNSRDVDLALVPISSEKTVEPSVVFSAHDITQHKELERLRERFVADAVHDLSTPIAALAIRLHLLKTAPDQLEKHVQSLERQVEHLSHLLDDLQMLSRLDRGVIELELTEANLNQIVQRVFDTYEPIAASKQQSFTFGLAPNLPPCRVDARQIGRVIVNLVSNAINYTYPEKTIMMRTYTDAGRVCFSIQDEGIGMSAFEQAHAFDRFYRADQARKERETGTGLGLAIVKEIVERHGGTVGVESTLGVGSTFTICLPL